MNDSLSAPLSNIARGQPTHDEISSRAQQIWETLGRPVDRDMEIWLQAERELQPLEAVATPPPASATEEDRSAAADIQTFPTKASATPRKPTKRSSKSAAR